MAFTLRQLQFFVAVAELSSVTGAARALSISQSSVTEAIRALEKDLGTALFERQGRGLEITRDGEAFLCHARRILADVTTARSSFRDEARALTGRLSLGVTSLAAGYMLAEILPRYRRAHPGIELSVVEDHSEALRPLLAGGALDVAVLLTAPPGDNVALHQETLLLSPCRLWLPQGHPLAGQERITLGDLEGQPLIQLMGDEIGEITRGVIDAMAVRPASAMQTRSLETLRSLVASGAGLALLPDLVSRPWSPEGDRIIARDVSGDLPAIRLGLAWRRSAPLTEAGLAFQRIAREASARR